MWVPSPSALPAAPALLARRRLLALPLAGSWLGGLLGGLATDTAMGAAPEAEALRRRALTFPRDHGAHLTQGIEWWYLTGWLEADDGTGAEAADRKTGSAEPQPALGFQLTFFRRLGPAPPEHPSPLAARQLLMAHAALTVLPGPTTPWAGLDDLARLAAAGGGHLSAQRIARVGPSTGGASTQDTEVHIGPDARHPKAWRLVRRPAEAGQGEANSVYDAAFDLPGGRGSGSSSSDNSALSAATIALSLQLAAPLPPLLQGDQGWSRKGPRPEHASYYVSEPQLQCRGQIRQGDRSRRVSGRAWLDHEWSSSLLPEEAVGWDWLGINLFDGSALTLFRLRRGATASFPGGDIALWAGGSWRTADGRSRALGPEEIRMQPLSHWTSPQSRAVYPLRWRLTSPLGEHELVALLADQEVDARASTATRYWEGLAELRTPGASGRRIGLGYLELTGYGGRPAL